MSAHECSICQYKTTRKGNLVSHIKSKRHLDLINRRQYSEDVIDYEAKYNELIIRYDRMDERFNKNHNIIFGLYENASGYENKYHTIEKEYKEIVKENLILKSEIKCKNEVIEVLKSIIRPLPIPQPIQQPIYIEEECEND